jgi:hypothetical protein
VTREHLGDHARPVTDIDEPDLITYGDGVDGFDVLNADHAPMDFAVGKEWIDELLAQLVGNGAGDRPTVDVDGILALALAENPSLCGLADRIDAVYGF